MIKKLVNNLCAPETGNSLELEIYSADGEHVIDGRLIDQETGDWYRIENSIAELLPTDMRDSDTYDNFCSKYKIENSTVTGKRARSNTNYEEQINFFKNYHVVYEKDVVSSPFYKILDKITVGDWIKNNLTPGQNILEVGCGSARQTLPLLDCGVNVTGIDLSEEMLQLAQRKVIDNNSVCDASFIVGCAEMLPVKSNCFDAAIIYGSLHHFSDPCSALKIAADKVKLGGSFYIMEPHNSPVRFIFDWMMEKFTLWEEEAADEPLFDSKQFTSWLESVGFQIKIKYSTYLPPHFFYIISQKHGERLLSASDAVFSSIPGVRKLAGVIIAEGVRQQ